MKKWDSGLIAREIRGLYRKGIDISYNAMARVNQGLISSSNYYYGSYRKAVAAAGIDYADICRKPRWNRQRVVDMIRKAHRAGEDLSWAQVCYRHDELGCAAKAAIRERVYGNWNDAIRAAGLDPEEISRYRHWEPDTIIRELRARIRRKKAVNSKAIQEDLPGLYGAAVRQFKTYDKALEAAGADPADISHRREWSRKNVLERLRDFEKQYGLVSQVMLRQYDSGLLRAIRVFYGTLKKAIVVGKITKYSIRGHRIANATGKSNGKAKGKRTGKGKTAAPLGWRKMRAGR